MINKEKVLNEVIKKYEKFGITKEEIQKYLVDESSTYKNDADIS